MKYFQLRQWADLCSLCSLSLLQKYSPDIYRQTLKEGRYYLASVPTLTYLLCCKTAVSCKCGFKTRGMPLPPAGWTYLSSKLFPFR